MLRSTTVQNPYGDLDALAERLPGDGRTERERRRLARLVTLLAGLDPTPIAPRFPHARELRRLLAARIEDGDGEAVEEAFLELYCHLHMHEAPYTDGERAIVDATGGYWCHAGGVSPLLRAGPWIGPATVSADFGAGNGLQSLLLQALDPHALTVQVEISSEMVAIGRELQAWLGVPPERVRWVVADLRDVPPVGLDFLYLYRPLKPVGPGAEFYRRFAACLDASPRPVVVFSVADCLGDFLSPRFEHLESDGHLTCWRGPVSAHATGPAVAVATTP